MTERIDGIIYATEVPGTTLYLDGPSEFLVASVSNRIKLVEQWGALFGEFIDSYRREDYPIRSFPAVRFYNEGYIKEFDSWFINGDLKADIIFPASIRRKETQQLQDSITSAMLQQFRRPSFFNDVLSDVPGLNELGKVFSVDKSLGFTWNEQLCPVTQLTMNFRIDLRIWDDYLEQTLRTKDDPFVETLGALRRIATTIRGISSDTDSDVDVGSDQNI